MSSQNSNGHERHANGESGGAASPGRPWVGGATGFLGSHVRAALEARGAEVVAVSRSGGENGRVRAVDVLDAEAVRASAEGCDTAFLCAGKVTRSRDSS